MAVSKRTRFEVLRRDDFTCRYCRSKDSELTVDHVVPVALGGTDDPGNLVAACRDCNAGKGSTGPGEESVAQVSEDALRWSMAMKRAADEITAEREADEALLMPVLRDFIQWLPGDWDQTMRAWLRAGLTADDCYDCMAIALAKPYVNARGVFAYACGIARNKIAAIQERAKAYYEAGEA